MNYYWIYKKYINLSAYLKKSKLSIHASGKLKLRKNMKADLYNNKSVINRVYLLLLMENPFPSAITILAHVCLLLPYVT